MVGPSAATTDILWRFFVVGLLALLVVDLIGLLVMTGLGKILDRLPDHIHEDAGGDRRGVRALSRQELTGAAAAVARVGSNAVTAAATVSGTLSGTQWPTCSRNSIGAGANVAAYRSGM